MAVTFSADGAVGTITLDNPPANSYDIEFMRELADAIRSAGEDAGVRVVVIRSSSEKFFSAGADVKRFLANSVEDNMEMIRLAHEALAGIARSPKLFVAFVAGHALGGGLEIALACDVRYAVVGRAKLGTPEVTLGLLPGNGGTQRLPRLIGVGPALELLATGRQLGPDDALRLGLVSEAVRGRRGVRRARRAAGSGCRRWRWRRSSAPSTTASRRRSMTGWHWSASSSRSSSALRTQTRASPPSARSGHQSSRGPRWRSRRHTAVPSSTATSTATRVTRCPSPTPPTVRSSPRSPVARRTTSTWPCGLRARAFAEWSALAVSKRGEILGHAAHHVEQHLDELIPLLTREQGKTLRDARIEVTKAIDTLMHYVGLSKALRGAHTPNLDPGVDGIVLRRPLGVVGAIVPWNFPTTLLANKLAPALVAGNTVVAKPAGTTPLTTLRFVELLHEGGLPAGVFNVVTGGGSKAGARWPPTPSPEDRLHRLDAGRRADHGAVRQGHQARRRSSSAARTR